MASDCEECGSSKIGYEKGVKFCRECGFVIEQE